MVPMILKLQRALILSAVVVLAFGACTPTPELEEVRAMAQDAKQSAAEAQQAAQGAQSSADKAQATADDAMTAAKQAKRCCSETNEKIDRMFKKSMYK